MAKKCAAYILCQTKCFCLGSGKFCIDHHKTHKTAKRTFLAQVARMHLIVNHWHIELWNMMKKLCHLYCPLKKKFASEDIEIVYRPPQDTYQQTEKTQNASSNSKDAIISNQPHSLCLTHFSQNLEKLVPFFHDLHSRPWWQRALRKPYA